MKALAIITLVLSCSAARADEQKHIPFEASDILKIAIDSAGIHEIHGVPLNPRVEYVDSESGTKAPVALPGSLNVSVGICSRYRGPETWGVCFSAEVASVEGHNHTSGVPPVEIFGAPVCYENIPGDTERVSWLIRVPTFASQMRLNWVYSGKCDDRNGAVLADVRVAGLSELEPGPGYQLLTGTAEHPKIHYGADGTLFAIQRIASQYQQRFPGAPPLIIGDISLPGGGLFDVYSDWRPPHVSHRFGNQADIFLETIPEDNRTALEGIMRAAAARFLIERDHYHLDFAASDSEEYAEKSACY